MPTTLAVRRKRQFRPVSFTARHRLVAKLRAIGKSRNEISRATGYSCSHISRIATMRQAIKLQEAVDRQVEAALIERLLSRVRLGAGPPNKRLA